MPRSKFRWNERAGRYTLGGRFVSRAEVRRSLDGSLAATGREVARLSASLQARTVSLTEWERLMRQAIKDSHLYSAALARGGWAQMTPAAYGTVGRAVRDQYAYLNRFAAELEGGLPMDGRFKSRTEMYMESGRTTFYKIFDKLQEDLGMTEESNILHSAEHCVECIEQSDLGWVELGTLTQIGTRLCLVRCRCEKLYR